MYFIFGFKHWKNIYTALNSLVVLNIAKSLAIIWVICVNLAAIAVILPYFGITTWRVLSPAVNLGISRVLQTGGNCIKIGLPGKLILSKRKGLREVLFSWK